MWLRLDHLIIRAADPAGTPAERSRRAGAPVLVPPTEAGGFLSVPLAPDTPVRLHPDGPPGVRRIILTGAGEWFALGDVAFEVAG